ncbi:MAG: rhomboid family intramembrane serine protease [Candidatus Limnocylindrales bacterium]
MDDARPPVTPDPSRPGRLSRDEALAFLGAGDAALGTGDYPEAAAHFSRVVGFDDAVVTAAALLGLGEARYRLGDDGAALASWQAAIQVGETPSSYAAWRNVAAAKVRDGDLRGAIDAYRQADRRAPADDKAEIANRLGWLTKEMGDAGAARRYFARGRGDGPLISITTILIAASVIVSASALFSSEGEFLFDAFQLDKVAVAAGEYWRLWTVTLLHGSLLHLGFNMYALYLAGPIVERWYGSARFLLFYLMCAAGGSVASFVFGGNIPSVGASGAIFGLFGILLAANRLHHPVDRQSRLLVRQLGMLIVINIAFGFAVRGIDNAAHLGGLAAGLWLGAMLPPTRVQTLATMWQRVNEARTAHMARIPAFVPIITVGIVVIVVVVGLLVGTAARVA